MSDWGNKRWNGQNDFLSGEMKRVNKLNEKIHIILLLVARRDQKHLCVTEKHKSQQ